MECTAVAAEEVREASARLPERQRKALELRDRDGRSYEEIAAALGMSLGAVGQLIARARINLYDELRGTALASVALPDCERALPLIAMREDGQLETRQLETPSDDADWLDSHLAGCERCTLAVEQMGEAEAAYRAQGPERPGGEADRPAAGVPAPIPKRRPRRAILVASIAGLLLLGVAAAVLAATDRSTAPVESAAESAAAPSAGGGESAAGSAAQGKKKNDAPGARKKRAEKRSNAGEEGAAGSAGGSAETSTSQPVNGGSGGAVPGNAGSDRNRSSGKAAIEPTRQTSVSKPNAKEKAPSRSTSTPQSSSPATAPAPEPTPPAEEEVDEPGHRGEPPGKAVGRPPH